MAKLLKKGFISLESDQAFKIPVANTAAENKAADSDFSGIDGDLTPETHLFEPERLESAAYGGKTPEQLEKELAEAEAEKYIREQYIREQYAMEGEKIVENARRASEVIINNALDNARGELNAAINAGYGDGFEAGRNDAVQTVGESLRKISALMEAIKAEQDAMYEDFRDKMFVFASEAVKKVFHREMELNNGYLSELFKDAVKNITNEEFITITVSEAEEEVVTRNLELFVKGMGRINDFRIVTDKTSQKGTMIVETSKGIVDSSLNEQLLKIDSILERLKSALYSKNEPPESVFDPNADDDFTPFNPDKTDFEQTYTDEDINAFYDDAELPPASLE